MEKVKLNRIKFNQKLLLAAFVCVFVLVISQLVLYPARNADKMAVAIRFVKNSEIIKTKVGAITVINGFGLNNRNRAKEIEEKLRQANRLHENIGNEQTTASNKSPQVVKVTAAEMNWHEAEIVGTNETIKVKLYLKPMNFADYATDNGNFYIVSAAKFADSSGEWKEIPIGWLETHLLLYK